MDFGRLSPRFWLQNAPTCMDWDRLLNKALDEFELKPCGHTAKIGGLEVWVSNYPYAFGSPCAPVRLDVLPSTATRRRLRSALQKNQFDKLEAALTGDEQ